MTQKHGEEILILGAGGIGGTLAGRLAEQGREVCLVTSNPAIAEAITMHGLRAHFDGKEHLSWPRAVVSVDDLEPAQRFDLCIIAVPPSSAEDAARAALPLLAEGACFVCCPNGLIEERLAEFIPAELIVGGVVTFGASMLGPGKVKQTSEGGVITLGRLPQAYLYDDPVLRKVAALLEGTFPTPFTDNLRGTRWTKLALNCVVSSLGTVGGNRLGALINHRRVRRLALEVFTEVVQVARAEQVELTKISNTVDLRWLTLGRIERRRQVGAGTLVFKHILVLAAGMKYREMRSSMLRALERGRVPPVDFLNGEITRRGAQHGIPTPINQAIQDMIHEMAAGTRKPSFESIEELFTKTEELRGWPTSWKTRPGR